MTCNATVYTLAFAMEEAAQPARGLKIIRVDDDTRRLFDALNDHFGDPGYTVIVKFAVRLWAQKLGTRVPPDRGDGEKRHLMTFRLDDKTRELLTEIGQHFGKPNDSWVIREAVRRLARAERVAQPGETGAKIAE